MAERVIGQGLAVAEVVREVGSGLNGRRPRLRRVLSDPSAMVMAVGYRDRLARFGVVHLDAALATRRWPREADGCRSARLPVTWYGT
jgi:putative resolvase